MGGEGGMPPMFGGDATACDIFVASDTCTTQDGCGTSGVCSEPGGGTDCTAQMQQDWCEANSCERMMPCIPDVVCTTIRTSTPCNVQQGCESDPSDAGACVVKTVNGCVDVAQESACTTPVGCSWTQDAFSCGGTATTCADVGVTDCDTQGGCSVQ